MPTRSPLHRHASVLVRTGHLAGVVGVIAAGMRGAPPGAWAELLLLSGLLLAADDLWRFGLDWLRYLQAWVVLGKLALFAVFAAAGWPLVGLWVAFVLGSVIAHAPGELRHLPLFGEPGPCAGPKARRSRTGPPRSDDPERSPAGPPDPPLPLPLGAQLGPLSSALPIAKTRPPSSSSRHPLPASRERGPAEAPLGGRSSAAPGPTSPRMAR